jgi:hypothetical protein
MELMSKDWEGVGVGFLTATGLTFPYQWLTALSPNLTLLLVEPITPADFCVLPGFLIIISSDTLGQNP